jgi:hypothetical protein
MSAGGKGGWRLKLITPQYNVQNKSSYTSTNPKPHCFSGTAEHLPVKTAK